MALQVEFSETGFGVPVPEGYVKITGLYVDPVLRFVRMNVRCYYNAAVREEDVDIKRAVTEKSLMNAKDRMIGLRSTIAALEAEQIPNATEIEIRNAELTETINEIATLDSQYQSVSGSKPFYETKFEFDITQELLDGFLAQAYALLKSTKLEHSSNGMNIQADLTQAVDV